VDVILEEVGMASIAEKRVEVLSGGQRRRLALGMELVSSPRVLLCDEVTSGLDPKAEDEITGLLRSAADKGRTVLNITHSLKHLKSHDSVVVLVQGFLAYHASPAYLLHYFGINHQEDLYPALAQRTPEDWGKSWQKHKTSYEKLPVGGAAPSVSPIAESEKVVEREHRSAGFATQLGVVLSRRWKLFWRDRGQVRLQLALMLGFPCLVVVFALNGLPALRAVAELPEDLHLHSLRHYALTTLAKTDLLAAQKIAGHKSPSTTMIYTHIEDDYNREKHSEAAPLARILINKRSEAQAKTRRKLI
jgi:energy-coupling factor transporter ATP-binding protein EcfA2